MFSFSPIIVVLNILAKTTACSSGLRRNIFLMGMLHGMHPPNFHGGLNFAVLNCCLAGAEHFPFSFFFGALGGPDLFGETDLFLRFP